MFGFIVTKKSASKTNFLSTKKVASAIEDIIKKANKQIMLVSPYLNPSEVDIGILKQADNRGGQIKIIYGKKKMNPDVRKKLDTIENLEIFFNNELHAKCYFNEKTMVITSLNYLDYSERTNWEIGILLKLPDDNDIYMEAIEEIEIIEQASVLQKMKNHLQLSLSVLDEDCDLKMEYEFEKYVRNILCSEKNFSLEEFNTDYYKEINSSKLPDFIVTFKPNQKRFAIECKYLKEFHFYDKIKEPVINWANQEQINSYLAYSSKNAVPVTIVIGLGGEPSKPKSVYRIPLKEVKKYPTIYHSIYSRYKTPKVDKRFFLKEDGFVE